MTERAAPAQMAALRLTNPIPTRTPVAENNCLLENRKENKRHSKNKKCETSDYDHTDDAINDALSVIQPAQTIKH
jgi:hypothetical protein